MLLQLKDIEITDFQDNSYTISEGCETCEYGKLMATQLTITFSNGTQQTFFMENESVISMSLLIKFFTSNDFSQMSKKTFLNKLTNFLKKEHKNYKDFKLRRG